MRLWGGFIWKCKDSRPCGSCSYMRKQAECIVASSGLHGGAVDLLK